MRNVVKSVLVFSFIMGLYVSLYAHCQIPCGIYGDKTRFDLLREHITTIEKAMNQINELATKSDENINQLVRWVNNKDQHADEFTHIITYYFLAQRIKIQDPANTEEYTKYQNHLTLLHQMMVFAMKTKQTTDLENVKKLRTLVDQFENGYFSKADQEHLKEHK